MLWNLFVVPQAWDSHLKRNQSVMVDLFQGQVSEARPFQSLPQCVSACLSLSPSQPFPPLLSRVLSVYFALTSPPPCATTPLPQSTPSPLSPPLPLSPLPVRVAGSYLPDLPLPGAPQLKSQVRCLECGNVSVRFDPFTFLSLPLPMDSSIYVEVVGKCRVLRALPSPVLAFRSVHVVSVPSSVIHLHGSTPTKYGLLLNQDDKCRAVKKQLATYSGLPVASLLLVEVFGACIKVGRNNRALGHEFSSAVTVAALDVRGQHL